VSYRRWTDAELDEVLHLYAAGWTLERIARRIGEPWPRIREALRRRRPERWAATSRPGARRVWLDDDLDDAVAMLEATSRGATAEYLGCSVHALRSALMRYRPGAW
jgi:hypothetical protein